MDAAIALTTPGDVGTATLPDGYGSPSSTTVAASVGLPVQKYGRTTGFTQGSINAVNVDVDVCYFPLSETICFPGFEAHFVNQFSVPDGAVPFSASGDSGSLLVAQGSNQPVGLLFAGGEGLTIANPIDAVLQRFNVTIDGAPAGPRARPAPPPASSAFAGDGQVALSWTAPSFDGGSPITGYKVYRGTSPEPRAFLDERRPPPRPTWTQGSRTARPTTTRCPPRTSTARAHFERGLRTPPDLPFRPTCRCRRSTASTARTRTRSRTPAAGRTASSARASPASTSLNNQLACSMSTTCTAWRNNAQYGPDSESGRASRRFPATATRFVCTLRLQRRARRPSTGT